MRKQGDDGAHTYRIPGLTTTTKGTLIAVYDIRRRSGRDLPGDIDVGMSRSTDGGRTWDVEKEIVLRDDLPNSDLGYPTTIEYEPGKLFCCYYGQKEDGITCIMGTYFTID